MLNFASSRNHDDLVFKYSFLFLSSKFSKMPQVILIVVRVEPRNLKNDDSGKTCPILQNESRVSWEPVGVLPGLSTEVHGPLFSFSCHVCTDVHFVLYGLHATHARYETVPKVSISLVSRDSRVMVYDKIFSP